MNPILFTKGLCFGSTSDSAELIDYIVELRGKKACLINEKGQRLAEKLGTKWYNEGEKSTRYFLRLLNRTTPDDFKVLENERGEEVVEINLIEREIVNFYKSLYEFEPNTEINDDANFFN